jgi:hypothetical protein
MRTKDVNGIPDLVPRGNCYGNDCDDSSIPELWNPNEGMDHLPGGNVYSRDKSRNGGNGASTVVCDNDDRTQIFHFKRCPVYSLGSICYANVAIDMMFMAHELPSDLSLKHTMKATE